MRPSLYIFTLILLRMKHHSSYGIVRVMRVFFGESERQLLIGGLSSTGSKIVGKNRMSFLKKIEQFLAKTVRSVRSMFGSKRTRRAKKAVAVPVPMPVPNVKPPNAKPPNAKPPNAVAPPAPAPPPPSGGPVPPTQAAGRIRAKNIRRMRKMRMMRTRRRS